MHDAALVRELQRLADLGNDFEDLPWLGRVALQQVLQVHAGDELHGVIHMALGGLAKVIHGDNVRMIEPCERLGLAPEALGEGGFVAMHLGQQLHGHGAVEAFLHRLVHRPHAATVDEFEELVTGNKDIQLRRRGRREGFELDGVTALVLRRLHGAF